MKNALSCPNNTTNTPICRIALCAAILGFGCLNVEAASFTFLFTGSISGVSSGLTGEFNTSQTLSGSYTFDSTTPDLDPLTTVGRYAITSASVSMGGYNATADSSGRIIVKDEPGSDSLTLDLNPAVGPSAFSFAPVLFTWGLGEGTGTPFSSDALPLTPCSACIGFDSNSWVFIFSGSQQVSGQLTSLTATPEPASVALFGSGLAVLGLIRRQKARCL